MRKRNKVEKITKQEKIQGRIDHRNREIEYKQGKDKNISTKILKLVAKISKKMVGVTRKDKSLSKARRSMEKNSRRTNAKIAKKVSRPTGSKKRI